MCDMKSGKLKILPVMVSVAAASVVAMSSCSPYQQQGALAGGIVGAAAGVVLGDDRHDIVKGAAIGAAGGTAAAAINEESNRRAGNYNAGGDYYPNQQRSSYPSINPNQPRPSATYPRYQPTPSVVKSQPKPVVRDSRYPLARRTSHPEVVISPFDPTRKVGVKNMKSGDLARDPKNGKIFRDFQIQIGGMIFYRSDVLAALPSFSRFEPRSGLISSRSLFTSPFRDSLPFSGENRFFC